MDAAEKDDELELDPDAPGNEIFLLFGGRRGTLEDAFRVSSGTPSVTSVAPSTLARTGSGGCSAG